MQMRPDIQFSLRWHPYQLDPTIPHGGMDWRLYMERKFGHSSVSQDVLDAGRAEGIQFAFQNIAVRPNTLDSHRLIHWAGEAGVQDAVVERLFHAYFEQGRNIGDRKVLTEIASEAEMESPLIEDLLAGGTDLELIAHEDATARKMGVSGVPAFIFAGKFRISGAQEHLALVTLIDRIQELLDDEEEEDED